MDSLDVIINNWMMYTMHSRGLYRSCMTVSRRKSSQSILATRRGSDIHGTRRTMDLIHKNAKPYSRSAFLFNSEPVNDANSYLESLGYTDVRIQDGMKDALKSVFGKNITAANIKSIGAEGVKALAKSVEEQVQLECGDVFVGTVHVKVPHHKFSFDLRMKEGENFMVCATEGSGREVLSEYLECTCAGNMSCSTCHIILDPETYAKLDPPSEAELDMLDLAYEPTDTSRLGCQIDMEQKLDGMTITLPSGINDLWQ